MAHGFSQPTMHQQCPSDRIRWSFVLPLGMNICGVIGALRQLATRLATAGFHVLRFDYFGTGDSGGDLRQATPEMWIQNIRDAACEVSRIARSEILSLVGLRLGALIAAHAVQRDMLCKTLVQWDPIFEGSQYLTEMKELAIKLYTQEPLSLHSHQDLHSEPFFGVELSESAILEFSSLHGANDDVIGNTRVVSLFSSLQQQGSLKHGRIVEGSGDWKSSHRVGDALLHATMLQEIQVELSEHGV